MPPSITFGFEDQWSDFAKRHQVFLERFPHLTALREKVFPNHQKVVDPIDRVVYFLGLVCMEDFSELLLLAANGYGIGALKLLRGMYERAVTMTYLSEHPNEVDAFLNFHWIAQHKLLSAIRRTYGEDLVGQQEAKRVEDMYRQVKGDYVITACKACGTTTTNYTWSKLDFVTMAHKAGLMGKLIVQAYYLPLRYSHSTAGSIFSRLEETPKGIGFNPDPQLSEADTALNTAHNLMLRIFDQQWKHFALGDEVWEMRTLCHNDFMDCWRKDG